MSVATPRRLSAVAMMAAASVMLSGCWLTAGTYQEESAASPSPSPSSTPSPSDAPVPVPNAVLLPPPVAPKVEVPWKEFSDNRTKIRFKLPNRPVKHKDDYVTSYGGHIVSMEYATRFFVEDDHTPVTIVINPYTVTGAVYTSGQTFFSSMEKTLKDNGSHDVSLSNVHSGTVHSHTAVFGTMRFTTKDKRKHAYRQMVLITGSSWRLFVAVYLDDTKITAQDKRDVDNALDKVLDGLRMATPKA